MPREASDDKPFLRAQVPGVDRHPRWRQPDPRAPSRHKPYFVSVFHTKNSALQYDNYAYTFSAEPPFRIKTISRRPLSLRGKRVRFVSSITYLGFSREISEPMVGVAYGSDDEQGRLAIMPLRVLLRDMLDIEALSTDASSLSGPLSSSRLRLPFEEAEAEAA